MLPLKIHRITSAKFLKPRVSFNHAKIHSSAACCQLYETGPEKNPPSLISIVAKTFSRDVRGIKNFVKTLRQLKIAEKKFPAVHNAFDLTVEKFPENICFYYEDQKWTFRKVQQLTYQIANYFGKRGYKKNDNVALFMENCPEYVCIWLGLSRLGIVTPLINSNLEYQPLLHSLVTSKPRAIIHGNTLDSAMGDVLKMRNFDCETYSWGPSSVSSQNLKYLVETEPMEGLELNPEPVKFHDHLLYIYTSGTTGFPKPAVVKHSKYAMGSVSFNYVNKLTEKDVLYTCLPLYHTAAGLCGVGQALYCGTAIALRKKFSAKHFWTDCIQYKATNAQYIGELCRYLLKQEPSDLDKKHSVNRMIGNGLRPEIWKEFTERFNIKNISEIYGSSDGNCNTVNTDNTVGAVGFLPRLLYNVSPIAVLKIDDETGEPIRDPKTGLAVKCGVNEPGELVGRIEKNHPLRDFNGYATGDNKDNEKKIIRNVFKHGDAVFRSGDILVMDDYGYLYFKDRAGDTYRWKGENVSTAEVEGVISSQMCKLTDVVVYGVKVPHTEGTAGMVCIADPDNSINVEGFAKEIRKSLPSYAIPLFLRILDKVELTSTFKMKKRDLQKEGFDITKIKDQVYFLKQGNYVKLDEKLYKNIIDGTISV